MLVKKILTMNLATTTRTQNKIFYVRLHRINVVGNVSGHPVCALKPCISPNVHINFNCSYQQEIDESFCAAWWMSNHMEESLTNGSRHLLKIGLVSIWKHASRNGDSICIMIYDLQITKETGKYMAGRRPIRYK